MQLDRDLNRFLSRRLLNCGPVCVALGALISGCSPGPTNRVPTFPVETSITYRGEPLSGAFVALHPKTPLPGVPSPRANVDRDGMLHVSTFLANDGAPAGEYILTVEWYKPIRQGADVIPGPNVLPRQLASPQTSKLSLRVAERENVLPPITL